MPLNPIWKSSLQKQLNKVKKYILLTLFFTGLCRGVLAQHLVISENIEIEPIKITLAIPFCTGYEAKELSKKKLAPVQAAAVEYYQGLRLALDSLRHLGFQFRLTSFDTKKDSLTTLQIFSNPEITRSDIIIGPFFKEGIEMASGFCVKNNIYHIAPTTSVSLKKADPWLISPNTELPQYAAPIVSYFSLKDTVKHFIYLNDGKKQSELFADALRKVSDSMHLEVKWIKVGKEVPKALVSPNSPKTCIIFPTNSELLAVSLLKSLPDSLPGLYVVGNDSWLEFKTTDFKLWEQSHVYIAANHYVDYGDVAVQQFVYKFRQQNHSDPGIFAFKAWDQIMGMSRGWYQNPAQWKSRPDQWGNSNGLSSDMHYIRDPRNGGLVNNAVRLLKFENYKLSRVQ